MRGAAGNGGPYRDCSPFFGPLKNTNQNGLRVVLLPQSWNKTSANPDPPQLQFLNSPASPSRAKLQRWFGGETQTFAERKATLLRTGAEFLQELCGFLSVGDAKLSRATRGNGRAVEREDRDKKSDAASQR